MAEEMMHPFARSEYYLAKLCGMEVALPTPITRRELYLAKLCGMDVDLPEPITHEDFFLAKLCGMDVALPQPITRLELYMARACGVDVEVPAPVTREEWYWSNIQLSQEEAFNTFPFAIQSRIGNLLDYRIYGNSVQDDTPSPENPVEVMSVGDRTVNFLPPVSAENEWVEGYLTGNGTVSSPTTGYERTCDYLPVTGGTVLYFRLFTAAQ